MRGKDYLFYQRYYGKCAVLVKPELNMQTNMWLMGDPFLRAYYSIYDMDNAKIGLVGVAKTTRENFGDGKNSTGDSLFSAASDFFEGLGLKTTEDWLIKVGGGVGGCLLFCCLYCIFRRCCCDEHKNDVDSEKAPPVHSRIEMNVRDPEQA